MQTVNLQIIPNGVMPRVNVSQFDVGRQIQFKLYDGASAYNIPTGAMVRIDGVKPDKNGFSYEATYSGNTVTVETTDQMTVLSGDVMCELRIIVDDVDSIGTLNFTLAVEKSPIDSDTPMSDTDIPAIIALATEQMQRAEAAADNAHDSEVNAKASEDAAAISETNAGNSATAAHDSEVAAKASEDAAALSEDNAYDSEQNAKASEQAAKASEDILAYYASFAIPRFIIANNRLYISDNSVGNFIVANNRLYVASPS